jgi:hypothetical protein
VAEQVGNGFESGASAVKAGGKCMPEQMHSVMLNVRPLKRSPDRSTHVVNLQSLAQRCPMSNKDGA